VQTKKSSPDPKIIGLGICDTVTSATRESGQECRSKLDPLRGVKTPSSPTGCSAPLNWGGMALIQSLGGKLRGKDSAKTLVNA